MCACLDVDDMASADAARLQQASVPHEFNPYTNIQYRAKINESLANEVRNFVLQPFCALLSQRCVCTPLV